jgi:hypothetical protein
MTFLLIYIAAIILKLLGVPIVKEIEWKWFILAPIIYFLYKVVWKAFEWIFIFATGTAVVWYVAQFGMWLYK